MELLRSLVWMDYKLAVLFAVVFPLGLLIWATVKQSEAIIRLLIIYWRVASLLAITVYLLIAAVPVGYVTSLAARILIPICLWFWVDLNEEIEDIPPKRPLKLCFSAWRWAVSIYMVAGAIAQISSLQCAAQPKAQIITNAFCRLWLEAPWRYKEILHGGFTEGFMTFIGIAGLIIYVTYFLYFVLIRLGKQGRSAISS
uniref:DUF3177 family protein n=1 Tax=Desertifilum tharense IPPAS B-1220 TaxID=1781255 RepID=A0ACD5GPD4_9CYAN